MRDGGVWFPGAVLVMPPLALFVLWLRNPVDAWSASVGTWSAVAMLVVLVVLAARRRSSRG